MKRLVNLNLIALIAIVLGFTACNKNNNDEPNVTGIDKLIAEGVLMGDLDHEVTLDASKVYTLSGKFAVMNGGVLNIPAGTVIKATQGFGSYLIVGQGGKINATGTADKPIIMTADDDNNSTAGYWGGLIINGRAKLSGPEGVVATSSCEINTNFPYGGSDDNDNSGILTYVMVKYAGARANSDVEHNGVTLNGVGRGTKIENLFILESADDGIELFGGCVDVKNILVVNSDDDMFDNTQGYRGKMENLYGVWEEGFKTNEKDPRGLESDGNLDGKTPNDVNQSDYTIVNMTIDLTLAHDANPDNKKIMDDVIKIRRGAKANIQNALVKGTGAVKDLVDCEDGAGNAVAGTVVSLTNSLVNPFTGKEKKAGEGINVEINSGNTGCSRDIFSWTKYNFK